jgi:hypothetical protein
MSLNDSKHLEYVLPGIALGALIFLGVTIFSKHKKEISETFQIPQLKEHHVRLVRPDGSVDKIINIYNYQDSVLIFTSDSGNLCVYNYNNDRDRSARLYCAPIGWNIEIVNMEEE